MFTFDDNQGPATEANRSRAAAIHGGVGETQVIALKQISKRGGVLFLRTEAFLNSDSTAFTDSPPEQTCYQHLPGVFF